MSVEFKSVVASILGVDPLTMLDSSNREESLESLVRTCKENNLEKQELNPAKLIKLTMSNLKNNEANKRWQEQVLVEFERQVELIYSPIVPAKTKQQKVTEVEEHYKAFIADTKAREKRANDFKKFTKTKVQIGSLKNVDVVAIMDMAMNTENEESFNKAIELMKKL